MKKILGSLQNSEGVIMVVAIIILLTISAVGIGMVTNAAMSSTIAKNYKNKIQTFYASDGQMTLLGQQVIDSNENRYLKSPPPGNPGDYVKNTIGGCTCGEFQAGNPCANSFDADTTNVNDRWNNANNLPLSWIQYDLGSDQLMSQIRLKFNNNATVVYELKIETALSATPTVLTVAWSGWTNLVKQTEYWKKDFTQTTGRYVKITMLDNSNPRWIGIVDAQIWKCPPEVVSDVDTLFPQSSMTMYATSTHGGNVASNAKDGNVSTMWESNYSDPQRLYADCGSKVNLSRVVIDWDAASAGTYMIQGSNDATNWNDLAVHTDVRSIAHRIDEITRLSGFYRFIGVYGVTRTTANGYAINEIRLYPYNTPSFSDTADFGGVPVMWRVSRVGTNQFNLATQAYLQNSKWGTVFETPLKQYIERAGGGLVPGNYVEMIPVTFYDYHSNRTNPEFEQPCECGLRKNMVAPDLDSERKPVVGTAPHLNAYIAKWFRPWKAGTTTIPVYNYTTLRYTTTAHNTATTTLRRWERTGMSPAVDYWGSCRCNDCISGADGATWTLETPTPAYDSAFINMVIPDSLPFILTNAATGTYTFNMSGGFWPLDNKGFGNEWNTDDQVKTAAAPEGPKVSWQHNFSYGMELKTTFLKVPGLKFVFKGDDDIWMFLNSRLRMDLGGPHDAGVGTDTVLVDTCTGMTNGNIYTFDFFYCERKSSQSTIRIETNMLHQTPVTTTQRHWKRDYGTLD